MRPFRRSIQTIQDIIFELFLLIILGIYMTFTKEETEKVNEGKAHTLGLVCFTLVILMMIMNFGVSIYLWISTYIHKKKMLTVYKYKIGPKLRKAQDLVHVIHNF